MSARYYAAKGERWGFWRGQEGAERGKLVDAHSDNLEDGEQDGCRRHGGCELQHGRDIGSYLSRGDHPVQRIVARAASDSPECHEKHDGEIERKAQYFLWHSERRSLISGTIASTRRQRTNRRRFHLHPMTTLESLASLNLGR